MNSRFGTISDAHFARTMFRKIRQRHDENVHLFSESLFKFAEESYGDLLVGIGAHECDILGIFIDGLQEDSLRLKLMRENPAGFSTDVKKCNSRTKFKAMIFVRLYMCYDLLFLK